MLFQRCSLLSILIIFYLQKEVFSSPVLFWSNVKLGQSNVPLSAISPHKLITDYICELKNGQIQLHLFAVNDLTLENLQHGPQSNHSLLVDARKTDSPYRFFPNVAEPVYKTFSLIPQSNSLKCAHVRFQIASTSVESTLENALTAMRSKINQVGTDANNAVIIALINGPVNEQVRSIQRRDSGVPPSKVLIPDNNGCMFYTDKLYWNSANGTKSTGRAYDLDVSASKCVANTSATGNHSSVILDLVWNFNQSTTDSVRMRLIATLIGRYWYLQQALLNNTEYRYFAYGMHSLMDTPPRYSYACTTATFVRFENSTHGKYNFSDKFYLSKLQFQPFYVNGTTFGPPNYCTSFFTSGIWMGIVATLLCLGILLVAVRRMMTIKSNDRFDDPKGKPLVIKTQD